MEKIRSLQSPAGIFSNRIAYLRQGANTADYSEVESSSDEGEKGDVMNVIIDKSEPQKAASSCYEASCR